MRTCDMQDEKNYVHFLRRSIIEVTDHIEDGDDRGSPRRSDINTWEQSWIHITYMGCSEEDQ